MPFYERGPNHRIYYEESGSGFPLLIIPGGGLNSTVASLNTSVPFNPMETFKDDFRCIAADLRNANGGQSTGQQHAGRDGSISHGFSPRSTPWSAPGSPGAAQRIGSQAAHPV